MLFASQNTTSRKKQKGKKEKKNRIPPKHQWQGGAATWQQTLMRFTMDKVISATSKWLQH